MKVPVSWLGEFIEINISIDDLARRLTMAGLEVENVRFVGLPLPEAVNGLPGSAPSEISMSGLGWEADKIVVAAVHEVMPHPNADRLVLCRLEDGQGEHIVLTGAPNLYPFKGGGTLSVPLKVAYAREGARIYDGHQPGQVLTTLKRAKIRGVESYSMICSEKELGISDDHEGVIILDADAPVGVPLVDYMGDAVLDIALLPNMARNASILGIAREAAAILDVPLRQPDFAVQALGAPIAGRVAIEIRNAGLNPRFVLGLVEGVTIRPSPYQVQRRLRLAGMRPINNLVDATNYAMLEIGEPLHAFDYDVLLQRAQGQPPTIITRTAMPGERLTTLDGVERGLNEDTVLVCDTAGALSIAGVMGGAESEVSDQTRNILLEGAAWNFINIRKTVAAQKLQSEAAYRFSRGVHPAMAERGVRRGLELMRQWGGGVIAQGLIDHYPLPPAVPTVNISASDVERWLGLQLSAGEIAALLRRLEFSVEINGEAVRAVPPDHRLDIGEGEEGMADLAEEIARIYGYDRIPETRMSDELPVQRNNLLLDKEEKVRDLLVSLGMQEVINYRMTSAEREARHLPPAITPDDKPYVVLANPIASDRTVLRHSILAGLFEVLERNARLRDTHALFEIGPVFLDAEESSLPEELLRLGIVLTGPRAAAGWQPADTQSMDFFDLKGVLEEFLSGLRISPVSYEPTQYPVFHPGKCARVLSGDHQLGVFGEVHPLVHERYDWPASPILAAWFDLSALLACLPLQHAVADVPSFPPVLEDLAVVVDESLPAGKVAEAIRQAGGKMLVSVRLFDVYRSPALGPGKKSLAYSLTYQVVDRTLSDKDVLSVRQRIIRRLEQELGARPRA